ncbi:MAG TPA: class II aldolase/adducin family protein [Burkholderiales bacterium]
MARELDEVKYQVAVANRILSEMGLATHVLASLGHASMRVPGRPDLFVVKGRGYKMDALAVVRPEEMIVVDMEGNMVEGPEGASQCYEVKMHSCLYRERPEVQSVTHTHPRFTNVMALLNARLKPMCNEGHQLVRHDIPVFPHSRLILSEADGMGVVQAMGKSQALILRGHGAVTVGSTLEQSVMAMLHLEEQARMNWYAYCAAGRDYEGIPERDMDEFAEGFRGMRQQPHLQGPLSRGAAPRGPGQAGGVWAYYADKVSKDLR